MSWPLLREAQRDGTLGRRQLGRKMVLIFLARRASDDGLVKIGARVVADETGIDHRHVRRLLGELAAMGRIDLAREGSNGRGRAHTWRVLSAAEWAERRTEKEGVTPPIGAEGKGGVDAAEKGATSPPLELPQEQSPLPPGRQTTSPAVAPALPGLGPGEEGLSALGANPRAQGTNPRATGSNPRAKASKLRRQRTVELLERSEAAAEEARLEADAATPPGPVTRMLEQRRAVGEGP